MYLLTKSVFFIAVRIQSPRAARRQETDKQTTRSWDLNLREETEDTNSLISWSRLERWTNRRRKFKVHSLDNVAEECISSVYFTYGLDAIVQEFWQVADRPAKSFWGKHLGNFIFKQRVEGAARINQTWTDEFTVVFYLAVLSALKKGLQPKHSDLVRIPTHMAESPKTLKLGSVEIPLDNIDTGKKWSYKKRFRRMAKETCIYSIMRTYPLEDWLERDEQHANDWDSILKTTGGQYDSRWDWLQSFYQPYKSDSGLPLWPPTANYIASMFLKDDVWDDRLEKAMAFDLIGAHSITVSDRVFGGEPLPFVLALNDLGKQEVRPGLARYGADMYFTREGMPALIVTPLGKEVPRGSPDWSYWKFVWRSTLITSATLYDHLLVSHFQAANLVTRAVQTSLSPNHPMRRFLSVFTYGTIPVNRAALLMLLGPGGALNRASAFADFSEKMRKGPSFLQPLLIRHKHFVNDTEWSRLPRMLQQTPYFQHGRSIYDALKRLVYRYSSEVAHLCSENTLEDTEMIQFNIKMANLNHEFQPDRPLEMFLKDLEQVEDCRIMLDSLVVTLWTITGFHRHVGTVADYMAADLAAFSWKDGEAFSRPKQNLIISAVAAFTAKLSPKLNEDYKHMFKGLESEEEAIILWNEFRTDLAKIQRQVTENNKERKIRGDVVNVNLDPGEIECSVAV